MSHEFEKHHRHSMRLKDCDYAQAGAYFVTICLHGRECILGEVVEVQMRLNPFGNIVLKCWNDLLNHYGYMELDVFVAMPNHVHGIVILTNIMVGAPMNRGPYETA